MSLYARRLGLAALLALPFAVPAFADDVVLATRPVGECTLRVEVRPQEPHVLHVRAFDPLHRGCQIDPESLAAVLRNALSGPQALPSDARHRSLFLGRLIDYPWLSAYVARAASADRNWNARLGRPSRGGVNSYVAGLLSRPDATDAFRPTLEGAGYRITGASVEKVLVLPGREIPGLASERLQGRLPFDALTWFHLGP